MNDITSELFDQMVVEHDELKTRLEKLNKVFGDAIEKALGLGYNSRAKFNKVYPYNKFLGSPDWINEGDFDSIIGVNEDYIEFQCYVAGYGGDASYYVDYKISTSFVKSFYTDRPAFDKFFTDLYDNAVKLHEEKLEKQKQANEAAERAKFEELKKKFQQTS